MGSYNANHQARRSPEASRKEVDGFKGSPHNFVTVVPVDYPRSLYPSAAYNMQQHYPLQSQDKENLSEMSSLVSSTGSSSTSQSASNVSPPVVSSAASSSGLLSAAAVDKPTRIPNGEGESTLLLCDVQKSKQLILLLILNSNLYNLRLVCVFLSNGTCVRVDVEGSHTTSATVLKCVVDTEELHLPSLAMDVFALWMVSSDFGKSISPPFNIFAMILSCLTLNYPTPLI